MCKKTLLSKALLLLTVMTAGASRVMADSYVKVTEASDLVAGETYIIASSDGVAISYASSKLTSTKEGYTTADNTITMTTTTPMEFTLGSVSGNYSLKMSDGKFLGYSGSSTNFRNNQTNANTSNEQWTIAYNDTYKMFTIVNVQTKARYIGYSNGNKFAPYQEMTTYAPATLYKKQSAIELTATSNDESLGTVLVSGNTITATPAEGCRVSKTAPYTVTDVTATVVQNGNQFVVSASSACTVQINFETIPQHTATFYVNGEKLQAVTVGEDNAIEFPSSPADFGRYTFRGWIEDEIKGRQDEKPDMLTADVMGETDKTYYAVFATGSTVYGEKSYVLDYNSESDLSSSNKWGAYGTSFTYTASDGGQWVIKAYKAKGIQINTGKNSCIKVPDCPDYITKIVVEGSAKAVGLSASEYNGSGTISYIAYGTDEATQTIDLTGKSVKTGYIVPKGGNNIITKIVVNYVNAVEDYDNYCTTLTEDVAIDELQYVTFSGAADVDFAGSGVTAYTVKYENGSAKLNAVEQVPAGVGVVLKADAAGTYSVKMVAEAKAVGDNDLQVSDGTVTGGTNIFCLADGGNGVGFYRVSTTVTIPKGKCYLELPTGTSRLFVGFGDTATGISEIGDGRQTAENRVYDLQGRRVASQTAGGQPSAKKGLYVVNGKKMVIK